VLAPKLYHIQVTIAKVLSVGQKCRKHAVCMRCSEGEDEGPVQEPASLVEHAHGALSETCADHVLDLTNSRQFCALTRLLKLDLAGEQAPEDLRDKLVVSVGLCAEDLLQDEQVVMGILVLLAFKEKLGVVKEILAVLNRNLVDASAQLIEVELTIFAHLRHILTVRKECYKLTSLFFSFSCQNLCFGHISVDKLGLDLVLKSLAL